MLQFLLAAALLAPVTAPPAKASPQSPPPVVDTNGPASHATAAKLARGLAPRDLMIAAAVHNERSSILSMPKASEDARRAEEQLPGLHEALWSAAEPEVYRSAESNLPGLWSKLESLYASRLSERQALALLDFYNSPEFQLALKAETQKAIHPESPPGAHGDAIAAAIENNRRRLAALSAIIDGPTLSSVSSGARALMTDWVYKEDGNFEARIEKILTEAARSYASNHKSRS